MQMMLPMLLLDAADADAADAAADATAGCC